MCCTPVKRSRARQPRDQKLEANKRGETEAAALDRMKVNIVDPAGGLARQARPIVIGNIVGLAVEDVEYVEAQSKLLVHLIRRLRIEQRGRLRLDAVGLNQATGAKVASEEACRPRSRVAQRNATRGSGLQRFGNVIANQVIVGKPGARIGE